MASYIFLLFFLGSVSALAQSANLDPGEVGIKFSMEGKNFTKTVNVFLLMTVLSLAPAFIMMMTSFTRIAIVLGFLKQAMGTQQAPSAKITSALALFLTFFIMQPIWSDIYNNAIVPFANQEITETRAMEIAKVPLKNFMLGQARDETLLAFMDMAHLDSVSDASELPMRVIIPAFMVSELQTAFQMGFLIYLPFLLIDGVVAIFLMSMGMMMLPPMMVSMPFKILLFIMVDGWNLVVKALVNSFNMT